MYQTRRVSWRMVAVLWIVQCGLVIAQSDPRLPFPQNRVRDFYSRQAAAFLDKGLQQSAEPLPQFPGLDGGGFGHWGQNPEDVSFDHSLNETDAGHVVSQLTHHFGKTTSKGVNVELDAATKTTVLFDPERMTFVDAWTGQFVKWGFVRFGLMEGLQAGGERLWSGRSPQWIVPETVVRRYSGYYRSGRHVTFAYSLGSARILDHCRVHQQQIHRLLQMNGALPEGTSLELAVPEDPGSVVLDVMERHATATWSHDGVTRRLVLMGASKEQLQKRDGAICLVPGSGSALRFQVRYETLHGAAKPEAVSAVEDTDVDSLTRGGEGLWTKHTVETQAVPGSNDGPLAIDTLTLPHYPNNPFRTAMRIGGVGALSDGRIVVATLMGDVWVVSGVNEIGGTNRLTWQRIAAGLYRALGVVIRNDQILVLGSDQITALHDLNGDGETDFYECVTNQFPTTGGHDFCTSLQQDANGQLYWSVSAHDFGVARMQSDGTITSLGNGLRNSNGIGVSPDGRVVLASVQEGTWTPASAIFEVGNHSYHGLKGPRPDRGPWGYDLPLCFLPRGLDNSTGEIGFLPSDPRLGVLSGAAIGTSFGACQAYVVLRDVVGGKPQGAVVPLPGDFRSGVCRVAFSAHDGHVYLAGTEGWQSYAEDDGCLQRYRLTGNSLVLPQSFEAWNNGVIIRYSSEIDPASVRKDTVFCQQWNYLYSAAYGSPEFSVREPGRQGHDYVPVQSVHLLGDRRSVFLHIPQLHPVMQFHAHLRLRTKDGVEVRPDVFGTILNQRDDFRDYPGYAAVDKRPAPGFPVAEKYEQDPRLVKQEEYGTNFGWVSSSTKMSISAAPGLQFEPRVLRVAPGTRVSLAFRNGDPGMPHNVAVVRADAIDEFGEQSMQLASNPRAIATHYVPDDPREMCFSPILQPGDSYTLYFEAPKEEGEYRLVCTYPGHWRVMQGSLFVIADGKPLPETAFAPVRSFVRMWTTGDLADAAETLSDRSFERGRDVFESAGCIKCHKLADKGTSLGPELTKISERFRGKRLLQQILEPSSEINKQYQTWSAVLHDGRVISGLKMDDQADSITLLPNPLKPDARVALKRDEIDELEASTVSTMPQNLLITYSSEEILDLVAYIQSGGVATDGIFRNTQKQ